jgi:ElaB/YqjD/DUF883 family membrane-anchored ribosome-binding protein
MGEDERTASSPVGAEAVDAQAGDQGPRDPDEIRSDIEETRRELGDTVAAVAEKADVKAQAKSKVDDVKQRVTGKKDEFADRAKQAAPESGGQAAEQAKSLARENRTTLIVACAVVAGFVLGRMGR